MAHRCPLRVRFNEIDPYGHVNHAVYVSYLEVARTEALEACGIAIEEVAAQGLQLVVTRLDLRYRRAAGPGERLVVETELGEMRRASGVWVQRIIRPATTGDRPAPEVLVEGAAPEVLVEGEVTIGITDRTGRPTRPPSWLLEGMERLNQLGDEFTS